MNTPYIQDDDYRIQDAKSGYSVNNGMTDLTNYDSWESAIAAIVDDMESNQFYPDIWFINERGNVDLLRLNDDKTDTEIVESWV